MARRTLTLEAMDLLRERGVAVELRYGGKHDKLLFTSPGGRRRMYVCPRTPSDRRTRLNCLSDIRRLLRE